jgi:hypothetical protein
MTDLHDSKLEFTAFKKSCVVVAFSTDFEQLLLVKHFIHDPQPCVIDSPATRLNPTIPLLINPIITSFNRP